MKLLFNQKYSVMIIIVKRNMERNFGNEDNSNMKFKAKDIFFIFHRACISHLLKFCAQFTTFYFIIQFTLDVF